MQTKEKVVGDFGATIFKALEDKVKSEKSMNPEDQLTEIQEQFSVILKEIMH